MSTRTASSRLLRRALATAAAIGACLVFAAPVAAQDDNEPGGGDALTWSVQPAAEDGADGRSSFDYLAPAGRSITDHAQINNFSDRPLTLRLYSQDAVNTASGGFTLLPGGQPPADVGAWAGLDRQIRVPARDNLVVPFTLTVPGNAAPGDHSGGIVASLTTEATDQQGNPVLVDHRVGARIHVRVDGEINPALEISDLQISYARTLLPLAGGTLTLAYTVTNTGNVRRSGEQQLTVRGPFGIGTRRLALAPLPEILPGQSITTTVEVNDVAPLMLLTSDLRLQPIPPPQHPDDPPGEPYTTQATDWAMPWPELALLALAGTAIWGGLWHRRRRNRQRATTLAAAVAEAREQARAEIMQEVQEAADKPSPDGDGDGDGDHTTGVAGGGGAQATGGS